MYVFCLQNFSQAENSVAFDSFISYTNTIVVINKKVHVAMVSDGFLPIFMCSFQHESIQDRV